MDSDNLYVYRSTDADHLLHLSGGKQGECDCACEASNVSLAGSVVSLCPATLLRPYPALYRDDDTVMNHAIIFNPIAGAGVSLLGANAARVFELVDGERSVSEVAALADERGYADYGAAIELLSKLSEARLVYAGDVPPQPVYQPPTHMGVWLHITNQCNLRCTYCYIGKTNEQLSVALGKRSLRAVFEAARGQGVREVTLKYAGGEALLEAETIWALDDYAHELAGDITITSVILTNGTPLRPALIDELKRRNFRLAVSLDGLDDVHDAQRPTRSGRPSFLKVQRGLDLAIGAGLDINVSVVVGPGNMAALPELIDYLLDRNQRFSLTFLRDSSEASVNLPAQDEGLIAAMDATYQRIALRPPAFSVMNSALDRVQLEQPHFAACGIGESYVVIKHTGEVSSCQMLLDKPIGHVRQGNVLNLVQQRTVQRPHGTSIDDHEGCNTCQWRYRCAGGCPVVTFNTYGRFDRRSPFCGVYRALIPKLVALEGLRIARYCVD